MRHDFRSLLYTWDNATVISQFEVTKEQSCYQEPVAKTACVSTNRVVQSN